MSRATRPSPGSLGLLAWDAPFLPRGDRPVDPTWPRVDGPEVTGWPRAQRTAVAVQLLAATCFLHDCGFYAGRRTLRRARLERQGRLVAVHVPDLPVRRLDDAGLERHLGRLARRTETLLIPVLLPLLARLLPERRESLEEVVVRGPAWEVGGGWLAVLLAGTREAALGHPDGAGRALWACRWVLPGAGLWWVEDLVQAQRLGRALGPDVVVVVGDLEEQEVVRRQAVAAADGRDAVVLSSVPLPAAKAVGLDGGSDAVWVLAPRWELGRTHAEVAVQVGGAHPGRVGGTLAVAAAAGFATTPRPAVGVPGRTALCSPDARRVLGWLDSSPVGLSSQELDHIVSGAAPSLAELERLGLAWREAGRWRVLQGGRIPDRQRLATLATGLPPGLPAQVVAGALLHDDPDPAASWVEARLAAGATGEVLAVAGALARWPALAMAAAEAALGSGRLAEAERLLDGVPERFRGDSWRVLHAWWAEAAGVSVVAAADLDDLDIGGLPARLQVRATLVRAVLSRLRGARDQARLQLQLALERGAGAEAEMELAALDGPLALRQMARARRADWSADELARYLHLRGSVAHEQGAPAAATTAWRAALHATSGDDLRLVGALHGDLGMVSILLDRPAAADRHLRLAQHLLERCGSRRGVTTVCHNRGVLAIDRLDWRTGEELVRAARVLRGASRDDAFWLEELELCRSLLARGEAAEVAARLPDLRAGVRCDPHHLVLNQAMAGIEVHLALAAGDLVGAAAAAGAAEEPEQAAVAACVAAMQRERSGTVVTRRWGLDLTVRFVELTLEGGDDTAAGLLTSELERSPREAAVGAARAAAILGRQGRGLLPGRSAVWTRVEGVLAGAGLDGWLQLVRRLRGVDAVAVLAAVDGIVNAGTDALAPRRLEALGAALALPWLQVRDASEVLATAGKVAGPEEEVQAGQVRLASRAPLSSLERGTLHLLARHLAAHRGLAEAVGELAGGGMLGTSPALGRVREELARWAPLPVTVLILGEPGTGKELCARELHRQSRRHGSFVAVNCAGMPAALLEAELFGVMRGAYTGADRDRPGLVEEAEGGTLFLDEVGELPLELQGKLLRLLQEREVRRVGAVRTRTVDVRFVAATNRDLEAAVTAEQFRRDLYYRLSVGVIHVPPLRERPDDIEELARTFVHRCGVAFGRPGVRLAPAALPLLRRGEWPGNVRELESAVARAVAAARPGEVLGPDRFSGLAPVQPSAETPLGTWPDASEVFRRAYFVRLLAECGGNRSEAARRAGISRQTLLYHLRELGLGRR